MTKPSEIPLAFETQAASATSSSGPFVVFALLVFLTACSSAPRIDVPMTLEKRIEVTEAQAEAPFFAEYSTALGWGLMAPAIVEHRGNVYTLSFAPFDPADRKLYCYRVWRNGLPWSPAFCADSLAVEAGFTPVYSYQPPILFRYGEELFVAHGVLVNEELPLRTFLSLTSVALTEDVPAWKKRAGHLSAGDQGWNYLGGGTTPEGILIVAGWEWSADGKNSLAIASIAPPYEKWSTYPPVVSVPEGRASPLYTHVASTSDGTIHLLTSFGTSAECAHSHTTPTNYKAVAVYEGKLGETFSPIWSETTRDAGSDIFFEGDPCRYADMRFAQDLLQDTPKQLPIAIVLRADEDSTRSFAVLRGGKELVPDIAPKFLPAIADRRTIDAIKVTRLDNGAYVFVASSQAERAVAIVHSNDLIAFSPPARLEAPFGVGNSVKLSQPRKNGSEPSNRLFIWFSGNSSAGQKANDFLRYLLFELSFPEKS